MNLPPFARCLRSAVFAFALGSLGSPLAAAERSLSVKASADFLSLHLTGTAPAGATRFEARLAEAGPLDEAAPWRELKIAPAEDGSFRVSLPLPRSRWSEVEFRALREKEVLGARQLTFRPDAFKLLTDERLAALPGTERAAWTAYLSRSREKAAREYDLLAAECRELGRAESTPAPGSGAPIAPADRPPESWFRSEEARRLAAVMISYQTPSGGWSKAVDYRAGPRPRGTHWTSQKGDAWHYCGTIDNRTTTEQITLLAGIFTATGHEPAREAARRGLEYLFDAQFPNGGWPQNYPVESGYHEAITLNDNAMTRVLGLLEKVRRGTAPFAFIEEPLRRRAAEAMDRAWTCLAAAQVRVDGRRTVWCAQHHPLTLEPVWARKKEPPSLSSVESAELLKFLMREGPTRPEIVAMIEPALAWLDAHRLTGLRKTTTGRGTDYLPDATSQEIYWARFYDVQTGRPMFPGADDGVIYATYHEMAARNKVAYDFISDRPLALLEKEVPRWRKRLAAEK